MRLQFGTTATERARGDLPSLPVVNMFVEEAPTEETGIALQSRPGLSDRAADMGAGPVKALFKADGVLSGALFGVSGSNFYAASTSKGVVSGSGPFSLAAFEDRVFIAGGGNPMMWDGGFLYTVTFPDSAYVTKVVVGASRAIFIRADTDQFYWSNVLSPTVDALSFATAESQPDKLRDMLFRDDVLILFGAETVEFWPNTGDAALPFQPLEGRVFERGIRATGCATEFGTTFAWVTNNNQVCVSDPDGVISKPGLEAKIAASSAVSLWSFILEGTEFLALRLDSETWVFSSRSKLWSQFASYGETNWAAQCYAGGVFGSALDGKTLAWADSHVDLGGVLERRFRGGAVVNGGSITINNLSLRVNVGQTPYLTGDYVEPVVEMRLSRDAGKTWGNWKPRSLGAQGQYRTRVQWTACGAFRQPAVMVEFRCTDPIDFRVSDVRANEAY